MIRVFVGSLALAALASFSAPAMAAPADIALLQSYVGNYIGNSTLSGAKPTPIKCRLELAGGNTGKVTYTGRCSVSGGTFSLTGVFAFVDNHYEAAMTTASGMSGNVIGQRRGNGVSFSSKQHDDTQGGDRNISSTLTLSGGKITVEFTVADNKTGTTTTGTIPFVKS